MIGGAVGAKGTFRSCLSSFRIGSPTRGISGPKFAKRYASLYAARADLLRRLGFSEDAAKSYQRALSLVTNDSERRFLERRLREVQPPAA